MWTRIGFATARRQLRVSGAGVALTRGIAVRRPAIAHSGAILRRAFTVSRLRAAAAAAGETKSTKTRKTAKTASDSNTTAKPKKKKTPAVKAKKPKKTKKVLTEEEKQALLVRELKKIAKIREYPKLAPVRVTSIYVMEKFHSTGKDNFDFGKTMKSYKDIPASEMEVRTLLETLAPDNPLSRGRTRK